MTENLPQIAIPIGLFKMGLSGAGGDRTRLVKIRKDIFNLTKMHYGLQMTGLYKGLLSPKSVIIDIEYDGYKMQDPHSSRPMSFVTDDTVKPGFWLGAFDAPNANVYDQPAYDAVGKHKVRISVAARQAPRTDMMMTIIVPKDGATKTVQTTTTSKVPHTTYTYHCDGSVWEAITTYTEETVVTSVEVPVETEITYEGYSVRQVLGPRDFRPEAGGAVAEFEFEIFPSNLPPYDLPQD